MLDCRSSQLRRSAPGTCCLCRAQESDRSTDAQYAEAFAAFLRQQEAGEQRGAGAPGRAPGAERTACLPVPGHLARRAGRCLRRPCHCRSCTFWPAWPTARCRACQASAPGSLPMSLCNNWSTNCSLCLQIARSTCRTQLSPPLARCARLQHRPRHKGWHSARAGRQPHRPASRRAGGARRTGAARGRRAPAAAGDCGAGGGARRRRRSGRASPRIRRTSSRAVRSCRTAAVPWACPHSRKSAASSVHRNCLPLCDTRRLYS